MQGLSDREATNRRAAGQGNDISIQSSRTYGAILRDNLFTFINGVYFFLSLVLIALGQVSDVGVLAFVILLNVVVNVWQEVRAKQKLDKIALVTRPQASVMRSAEERAIDPREIVVGDVLVLRPGDQVVVDGQVIGDGEIKVDESLLTGESDLIPKRTGDTVYSGSFCVSGTACYEAEKVGLDSLASKMTVEARKFRATQTPLQRKINLMIRFLLGFALLLGLVIALRMLLGIVSFTTGVQNIAVVVGLVPSGLYLMITLAYTFGALRIAQQSALVQQTNAVESLSNVDVMCLDKTGTLTTNRIQLQTIFPLKLEPAQLQDRLGDYAASASTSNQTNEAIATAYPKSPRPLKAEVPFESAHKWSAIAFADEPGVYVLGAPEMLSVALPLSDDLQTLITSGANEGLRVLLFAYSPNLTSLEDASGHPRLPSDLSAIGLLYFGDELRSDVRQTLSEFQQAGIQVKVISGDNPITVAALAKQAGLSQDILAISGPELAQMDAATFTQTAIDRTVFGRITPEQKSRLVQSLQARGHYVAMMGDGVNDVLSLKQANVGVAMESGSQATRGVADIVLLKDAFSALPKIFLEGQRIRNGVADVSKLFMVRIFSFILTIVTVGMVTLTFPFSIKTGTIVTFLTVGIPPFFVTLWARPDKPGHEPGNDFLHFVLPATLTLSLFSIVIYLAFLVDGLEPILSWLQGDLSFAEVGGMISREDITRARQLSEKAMVTMQIFGGLLLLLFLKPPTRFWAGGARLSRDWRFTMLAGAVLLLYIVILAVPGLGNFFELYPLEPRYYLLIALMAMIWAWLVRLVWRYAVIDRFLGIRIKPF